MSGRNLSISPIWNSAGAVTGASAIAYGIDKRVHIENRIYETGAESVRKWLREHEMRNLAQLPAAPKPHVVAPVENRDQAICARTLFVAVLEHVPFTAPWREQKRLDRERKDWPRQLRQYWAAQTEPSCATVRIDRQPVRSRNSISGHCRLHESAAFGESNVTRDGSRNPNGTEHSKHLRGRVA
jgi:hypothetical protein